MSRISTRFLKRQMPRPRDDPAGLIIQTFFSPSMLNYGNFSLIWLQSSHIALNSEDFWQIFRSLRVCSSTSSSSVACFNSSCSWQSPSSSIGCTTNFFTFFLTLRLYGWPHYLAIHCWCFFSASPSAVISSAPRMRQSSSVTICWNASGSSIKSSRSLTRR